MRHKATFWFRILASSLFSFSLVSPSLGLDCQVMNNTDKRSLAVIVIIAVITTMVIIWSWFTISSCWRHINVVINITCAGSMRPIIPCKTLKISRPTQNKMIMIKIACSGNMRPATGCQNIFSAWRRGRTKTIFRLTTFFPFNDVERCSLANVRHLTRARESDVKLSGTKTRPTLTGGEISYFGSVCVYGIMGHDENFVNDKLAMVCSTIQLAISSCI